MHHTFACTISDHLHQLSGSVFEKYEKGLNKSKNF